LVCFWLISASKTSIDSWRRSSPPCTATNGLTRSCRHTKHGPAITLDHDVLVPSSES
jgi:hypothetical protein